MNRFSLAKKKFVTSLKVIERYTNVFILVSHPSSDENAEALYYI
ncbi:uncharacterized protein METZ01_LOCUS192816 [marine metagenome]|uniref:Uncharacterized protein n=1 Tax=marine metagenome TaxID=408172 RepID=A0A382DPG8_9ZZZZ